MKKPIIHAKCGKPFEVAYTEENIPYLVCGGCEYKVQDWIKWEQEYKNYWRDDNKWENKRDHTVCLLGYFAQLYRQHYGVDFVLSLNDRGLFKGPEAHHIRKLLAAYGGNTSTARAYLDWIFETKVKQRKKKITSLGFLNTETVLNEFNLARKKSQLRTRSTLLPEGMLKWLGTNAPGVLGVIALKDFGDLHTLLTHYRKGRLNESADVSKFVQKLITAGVITNELQINNWSD